MFGRRCSAIDLVFDSFGCVFDCIFLFSSLNVVVFIIDDDVNCESQVFHDERW